MLITFYVITNNYLIDTRKNQKARQNEGDLKCYDFNFENILIFCRFLLDNMEIIFHIIFYFCVIKD